MRTHGAIVATVILRPSTVGARPTATLLSVQVYLVVDVALDEIRDRCVVIACTNTTKERNQLFSFVIAR